MALIKLGALAQDVRGSLNGTTFSKNRGGAYVRTKVSPCRVWSPYASVARELFQAASRYWGGTLTPGQRAGWEAFAAIHPVTNRFGDATILSGLAWFVKANVAPRTLGQDWIEDAPTEFVVEDLGAVSSSAQLTLGTLVFTLSPGRVAGTDEMLLPRVGLPAAGGRVVVAADLVDLALVTRVTFAWPAVCTSAMSKRWPYQVWAELDRIPWALSAVNTKTGAVSAVVTGVAVVTV